MTFNIIGLIIGAMILCAGIYYLVKEKNDKESRRIYGVLSGAGALIAVGIVLKMLIQMQPFS